MPLSAHELIAALSNAMVTRVDKPWGGEIIIETSTFLLKLITVEDGKRTSLQHHNVKDEVMVVAHGSGGVLLAETGIVVTSEWGPIHVTPGIVHRTVGPCQLIEVTTKDNDDVVRHEDDYGRASTT